MEQQQITCPFLIHCHVLAAKCPAFHKGCPFAHKTEEYASSSQSDLPEGHPKCPIADETKLAEGKCPFSGALASAEASSSESKKAVTSGCPFSGKWSTETAGESSSSTASSSTGTKKEATAVGKCPAIQLGCPYAKDPNFLEKVHKCPTFQSGCPFAHKSEAESASLLETGLKDCPAFKHKCPFSGATKEKEESVIAHISKCPVFQRVCPHSHPAREEVSKQCPVLEQGAGCPFAKFHAEEIAKCPALKDVTTCPFIAAGDGGDSVEVAASSLAALSLDPSKLSAEAKKCPAFKSGCPYAKDPRMKIAKDAKKCPAFEKGCPFSNKSSDEIKALIASIPPDHPSVH